MAEEIDLIEETNDDIENWIYYNNDPKTPEEEDINSTEDSNQQSMCIDYSNTVVNDENNIQYNGAIENDYKNAEDNANDTSDHNLILREIIDENGHRVEEYFCQQCNMSYSSIEEFLGYHPLLELLNENPEDQEEPQHEMHSTAIGNKLWDLVENLDEAEDIVEEDEGIVEIKPNIAHDESLQEKETTNNTVEAEMEQYFCYDCQQVFTDLTTAENHDCNDQLQNNSELSKFNSTLHSDNDSNVYRCELCSKDYTSLRSFTNHQRWHKKSETLLGQTKTLHDEPAVCEICNTIFASEKNLKLHMKMHKKHTLKTIQEALPVGAQNEYKDLNQFFCEICNKSFDQKLLVIHKNMHLHIEEYSCGKCNKNFENLPSYEIHMHMHGDNVKKLNAIKIRNGTNASAESPSTSSQGLTDGGKRKHACQYCGKEFQRPYEKVKHERIHTGEKPYECEVCGKTFRVSYSLTLHLRTHTDIRPYVCATCNKRFKQQSVYVHHLKTHVLECAYKCDICGKSFRTSVQLSGHKNIHTKPYNCTECNRPFASLYAVKIHMKTHNKCHKSNKNLKNRCTICGASYARVFALSLHIKEQHGIDVDSKLLAATNANTNTHKKFKSETAEKSENAEDDGSDSQMHFSNDDNEADNEQNFDNDGIFGRREDHKENFKKSLANDMYIDETEAATQAILNTEDDVFGSQVDHEENIQDCFSNNVYIDETEAATQTILNTEQISVDNFPTEEIITDWLSK